MCKYVRYVGTCTKGTLFNVPNRKTTCGLSGNVRHVDQPPDPDDRQRCEFKHRIFNVARTSSIHNFINGSDMDVFDPEIIVAGDRLEFLHIPLVPHSLSLSRRFSLQRSDRRSTNCQVRYSIHGFFSTTTKTTTIGTRHSQIYVVCCIEWFMKRSV